MPQFEDTLSLFADSNGFGGGRYQGGGGGYGGGGYSGGGDGNGYYGGGGGKLNTYQYNHRYFELVLFSHMKGCTVHEKNGELDLHSGSGVVS